MTEEQPIIGHGTPLSEYKANACHVCGNDYALHPIKGVCNRMLIEGISNAPWRSSETSRDEFDALKAEVQKLKEAHSDSVVGVQKHYENQIEQLKAQVGVFAKENRELTQRNIELRIFAKLHEWQLIEQAPKDGTHILGIRYQGHEFGYLNGQQIDAQTVIHYWSNPGEEGFYTSINEVAPEHCWTPTHWKPLIGLNFPKTPEAYAQQLRDEGATAERQRIIDRLVAFGDELHFKGGRKPELEKGYG